MNTVFRLIHFLKSYYEYSCVRTAVRSFMFAVQISQSSAGCVGPTAALLPTSSTSPPPAKPLRPLAAAVWRSPACELATSHTIHRTWPRNVSPNVSALTLVGRSSLWRSLGRQ
eukprot:COSAG01_NODE_2175_length_8221_cov_34.993722_9_plen_113_part_00